jgi:hypothetical protein
MRVVPTFDPLKNGHLRFGLTSEATTVQQLALERCKKTLRHRVVVGITDRSHRGHDTGFATALAEGVARVLGEFNRSLQHFYSEVAMTKRRRSDRAGRAKLSSPGRPPVARRGAWSVSYFGLQSLLATRARMQQKHPVFRHLWGPDGSGRMEACHIAS